MHARFSKLKGAYGEGNQIYVMREDLLPFSMGGNKVRIAEEFFIDMKKEGCDTMIAYGNVRSNLCRVIASRCCQEQIPCYIICSSEGEQDAASDNSNSQMMKLLDGKLVYCTKERIAETVEHTLSQIRSRGGKPYYIYGNKYGTGREGVSAGAYAKAYQEILAFEKEQGFTFDYIFHASGTGATQAGLTCGHLLAEDETRIMGILISSRTYERAFSIIRNGMEDYLKRIGQGYKESYTEEIHLLGNYTKGGYGIYDQEILDTIRQAFQEESLPLDPVYTGKAFWGMKKYLEEQAITGTKILFIHTGGTPLFYDCLNRGELDRR